MSIYIHSPYTHTQNTICEKTKTKLTRFLRKLVEQETQMEGFRLTLQERGIDLKNMYNLLTHYRGGDLTIDDLRYHFIRCAMQVNFLQFKMIFNKMDKRGKERIAEEQFIYEFQPWLSDEISYQRDKYFDVYDHMIRP